MARITFRILAQRKLMAAPLLAAFVLAGMVPTSALAGQNGIDALRAAAQLRAQNANDEALEGADKQRDLVKKQKKARATERNRKTKTQGKKASDRGSMKLR